MSIKFASGIDMDSNELENVVVQNLSEAPSNPVYGQVYYNTTDSTLYCYNGSSWMSCNGITSETTSITCELPENL